MVSKLLRHNVAEIVRDRVGDPVHLVEYSRVPYIFLNVDRICQQRKVKSEPRSYSE